MSTTAIRVRNLGKQYQLGVREQGYATFREAIIRAVKAPFERFRRLSGRAATDSSFWALKDLSFDIQEGEILGIIGRNGAGKSTLLKVLSQITEPTEGEVEMHGRVGSLLEVGTGFHPELTGRENIYLNGAIMGMKRAEITRRFDEIVAFAEVERFLDTPVKRYSSGMYTRLAFAVAAHLEPEILVVDEVLAVGDAAFQKKCLGKMGKVAAGGRTVLFVSHNMAALQNLCQRILLLEHGKLSFLGDLNPGINRYLELTQKLCETSLKNRRDRDGNGFLRFTSIHFLLDGAPAEYLRSGGHTTIVVEYQANVTASPGMISLNVGIYTLQGQCISVLGNELVGVEISNDSEFGAIMCTLPRLPLPQGRYFLNLYCTVNGTLVDWVQEAATIDVEGSDYYGTGRLPPRTHGGVLLDQAWSWGAKCVG